MENSKKYLVSDAYAFGIKNVLAYYRPLFMVSIYTILSALFFAMLGIAMIMILQKINIAILMQSYHTQKVTQLIIGLSSAFFAITALSIVGIFFNYFGLRIVDGTATQNVQLPSINQAFKAIIALAIKLIVCALGMMLFIIPGILWLIRSQYTVYAIFDDNVSIMAAFKRSFAITKGNGWLVFTSMLLSISLIHLIPSTFLFIIPISATAGAYIYKALLKSSKEPIAS